jgi:hypothetical protein
MTISPNEKVGSMWAGKQKRVDRLRRRVDSHRYVIDNDAVAEAIVGRILETAVRREIVRAAKMRRYGATLSAV